MGQLLPRKILKMLSNSSNAKHRPREQPPNFHPAPSSTRAVMTESQPSLSHIRRQRGISTLDHPKATFSPFDRLPVELHAEIFSHCLDAFPHLDAQDEPPLAIARVCGAWRALVYATPKLWASFEIEVQDFDTSPDPYLPSIDAVTTGSAFSTAAMYSDPRQAQYVVKLLNSVQIWLERSRNHPLSVRVVHMPSTPVPGRLSAQLLAMLAAHARRWRTVEFVLPSTSLALVQGLFPEEFPALKHLKIHMKGQWSGSTNAPGGALGGGSFGAMLAMGMPWTQLTRVDLRLDHAHLLNLDAYLELLSDAPNLVECSFNAICALSTEASEVWRGSDTALRYVGEGEHRVLRLPSLERLHLVLQANPAGLVLAQQQQQPTPTGFLGPGESFISFLSLFSDCKLSHLHVDWLIDPPTTPLPPTNGSSNNGLNPQWGPSIHTNLQHFLRGLRRTLRSLQFSYLPLGEEQLLQCLAQLSGGFASPPGSSSTSSSGSSGPGVGGVPGLHGVTGLSSSGATHTGRPWTPNEESKNGSILEALDLRFSIADHEMDPITDRFFKSLQASLELVGVPGSTGAQHPVTAGASTSGAVQLSAGDGHGHGGSSHGGGPFGTVPAKLSAHLETFKRNAQTALGVGSSSSSSSGSGLTSRESAGPSTSYRRSHSQDPSITAQGGGQGRLHTPQHKNPTTTASVGGGTWFPRLKRLRVHCSGEKCSGRALAQFIRSRTQRGERSRLEEVHLYSMTPVVPDAARYAEGWKKVGVEVVVESVVLM